MVGAAELVFQSTLMVIDTLPPPVPSYIHIALRSSESYRLLRFFSTRPPQVTTFHSSLPLVAHAPYLQLKPPRLCPLGAR